MRSKLGPKVMLSRLDSFINIDELIIRRGIESIAIVNKITLHISDLT